MPNQTDDAHHDPASMLEALLGSRYSCRAFLPEPVPRAVIERILTLAQRTPSWCNTQPWHVTVTTGVATERLRALLLDQAESGAPTGSDLPWPSEYRGVYQQRRRDSGFGLYEALGIARDDTAARATQARENFRLFGAPHLALITSDAALGPYGAVDCGAYVMTFLLAAQALGVSAVPQAALARHAAFLRSHLGITEDRLVICGISFGYADTASRANGFRTTRADLGEAVSFRDV